MNYFKLRTIKPEKTSMKKYEKELADLLKILPTTKQYGVAGEVSKKIRKLRDGRKQRHLTLELSRSWPSYDKEKDVSEKKIIKISRNEVKYVDGKAVYEAINVEQPIDFISERKLVSDKLIFKAPLLKKSSGETMTFTKTLSKLKEKIIKEVKEHREKNKLFVPDFTYREGLTIKRFEDNVHVEEKDILKLMNKKVRYKMKDAKNPGDKKDYYVGVEFEFACTENKERVSDVLFEAGIGKCVQVKGDSSITTDGDTGFRHGIEINVVAKQSEINEIVTKACQAINTNLNIRVDKSCGLHVHLDMRNRDVTACYYNLAGMQHFFYAMNPAARLTGTYSVPVGNRDFAKTGTHYHGVSNSAYQKYKTIEIRMHCGTTQADKINNWINFLVKVAEAPQLEGAITSTKMLQHLCGFSDDLTKYVEGRIAKFYKQHAKLKGKYPMLTNVEEVAASPDELVGEESEVA